jgi:DNA topoisomerase-1
LLSLAGVMPRQWIIRRGNKRSGFRYVDGQGRPIASDAVRTRIDALRIPPAWTDVHIAAASNAAVQAWGFDVKGRKQYRYHTRAVERGALRKYYRVRQMARDLPTIRRRLARDFRGAALTHQRVTAGVVRLISEGFFRVGSERYAMENRTFGIATMQKRHAVVHGDVIVFAYIGKKSIAQRQTVCDASLARFVEQMRQSPGRRLFRYQRDGAWHDLTARDVNAYLHELVGVPYTAKDFRTWGGTLRVATVLSDLGAARSEREATANVALAVRLVAAELGNTPTICRKSYVHPMVIARYLDEGATIEPYLRHAESPPPMGTERRARRASAAAYRPEERALISFLDVHFPERRKAPREGSAAA